jgi:hypothetical protein
MRLSNTQKYIKTQSKHQKKKIPSMSSKKTKPINAITTLYKTKQKTKHGHR